MSHMTSPCRRRRTRNHTSPRHALPTLATVNDTSQISESTSFFKASTRQSTSGSERMKKLTTWHCPQKNCLRGVQVPSTCLGVDNMDHHVLSDITQKRAEIQHVFTCPHCVFSLSNMTDFRWRPGEELPCQSRCAQPFFLTSQKTTFSYSVMSP
jgi:hypothetical protein